MNLVLTPSQQSLIDSYNDSPFTAAPYEIAVIIAATDVKRNRRKNIIVTPKFIPLELGKWEIKLADKNNFIELKDLYKLEEWFFSTELLAAATWQQFNTVWSSFTFEDKQRANVAVRIDTEDDLMV